MATKRSRLIFKPLVFLVSLIPLGWIVFAIWSDTSLGTRYMTSDPTQKLNRELGDWALIFVIVTLAVRPAAQVLKTPEIVSYRRMIGLFAFFYALLHLSSYIGFDLQLNLNELIQDVIKRTYITIGMLAFICLLPLAITSTRGMIKRLGSRRWLKLHMLIYLISILGAFHFYMMVRAGFARPMTYASIIVLLLGYRVWESRRKAAAKALRRKRASAT
ncbi:MAG: sulfoxide reductase heme-binding subunit YedZ [Rhodospirillaceae bacterium]|jgi:methionine sulfoxide reductase heme-binding subunit|nr:sulfoxide reductase heme-binding subunit YedZ [Rhodospirillaceae bacterium]MBT5663829.1 sulfoxide reductase heme-binding subunit YedZ [Rhodospirillaceae bacterium]MBT5810062.1 sulfoxide reductase heme-binding subunit YedZ [Rhodospirillaceae bacterium]